MGESQDRRNAFEPRLTDAYTHDDPVTGYRDKVGDENLRRKLFVASSLDQGSAVVGNKRGNIFAIATGSIIVYKDDNSIARIT